MAVYPIDRHGDGQHRRRRTQPPRPAHPQRALTPGSGARQNTLLRSEEHTSELQSRLHLVCRLLLEKKKKKQAQLSLASFPSSPERRLTLHRFSAVILRERDSLALALARVAARVRTHDVRWCTNWLP